MFGKGSTDLNIKVQQALESIIVLSWFILMVELVGLPVLDLAVSTAVILGTGLATTSKAKLRKTQKLNNNRVAHQIPPSVLKARAK